MKFLHFYKFFLNINFLVLMLIIFYLIICALLFYGTIIFAFKIREVYHNDMIYYCLIKNRI